MFKTYVKIAFRNIRRNPIYSAINILGLAIGLASAIVIGLWVHRESSYDQQFDHADRIYRVGVSFMNIGRMAPGPEQFNEFARKMPQVELTASLSNASSKVVSVGSETFKESNIFFADSTFFDLFSYQFVAGNRETALDNPHTVVLTQKIAGKYFQNGQALGQTIELGEDKTVYTVTGVIKKIGHSHIPAELFFHFDPGHQTNWLSAHYYNYVLLRKGVTQAEFQNHLNRLVKNTVFPTLHTKQSYQDWIKTDAAYHFIPMPITDIYLKSHLRFDLNTGGNEMNVFIFTMVSIFILLIAAVNFINITTARASNRAKEVGVRKSLGGRRLSLVGQFLAESVITSLIALVVSLGLAELFLAIFERFIGLKLLNTVLLSTNQILIVSGATILIGILAGLYPAFYLSSFRPTEVLKGRISNSRTSRFRNLLVVVQFTIAICLLACTGLVYQQLQFMRTKDLGLNTRNVLVISNPDQIGNQADSFKKQLLNLSAVESASYNVRIPAGSGVWINTFKTPGMKDGIPFQSFEGDYDFVKTMGFQLLKGRDFSKDIASDTVGVILNQTAVKRLELKHPIGARLNNHDRVIGVVSDFNFESLRQAIEPVAIKLNKSSHRRLAVKVNTANLTGLLSQVQKIWQSYSVAKPLDYHFLDQNFEKMRSKERVLAKAVLLFSLLAIIVSCLGLYGLSAYMCELRTKEIGVRKVLGASVSNIIIRLTKDFTKPVAVAMIIAIPVAFAIMHHWLNNFAYKIDIGPWVFVGACAMGLFIAWLTVSWQSLKTALMNPVKSLRNE